VQEGKPSPDGYLRAAELLGVPPSACLVLEDAPAGIEAARAAGTIVIALSTTHPSSSLAGARLVLGSLADVHLIGPPLDGRPLSLELDATSIIPA
jgi:sugar-phosphatase